MSMYLIHPYRSTWESSMPLMLCCGVLVHVEWLADDRDCLTRTACACRAAMMGISVVDRQSLEIDLIGHPLLNMLYYTLVEILPAASVLFILRKLPPKRNTQGYQQIPSQ